MLRQIGTTEIILIVSVVLLLVGGKKLPDLARGSGQALRIFKTEVKSLSDDETEQKTVQRTGQKTVQKETTD